MTTTLEHPLEHRVRDLSRQRDELIHQRDLAEVVLRTEQERNANALRLHIRAVGPAVDPLRCQECRRPWPCATRRSLTGADEAA